MGQRNMNIFLLSICLANTLFVPFSSTTKCEENNDANFAVLFDADLTNTQLYVYCWLQRNSTLIGIDNDDISQFDQVLITPEILPGITSFVNNGTGLMEYVRRLIKTVLQSKTVPRKKYRYTRLYFYGSGGFRLLAENDSAAMLNNVRTILRNRIVNPFIYQAEYVRILTGNFQATSLWFAVNAREGTLNKITEETQFAGIIGLDESSLYVSFMPKEALFKSAILMLVTDNLLGIYSKCYAGFGYNIVLPELLQETIRIVVTNPTVNSTDIDSPCTLRGDDRIVSYKGKQYQLTGASNYTRCLDMIRDLYINPLSTVQCQPQPCAFGIFYQPNIPPGTLFYATYFFISISQNINILGSDGHIDISQLRSAATTYCSKNVSTVRNEFRRIDQTLLDTCALALYMVLIIEELGFPVNSSQLIATDLSWTIGRLLYEIHQTPDVCSELLEPSKSHTSIISQLYSYNSYLIYIALTVCCTLSYCRNIS